MMTKTLFTNWHTMRWVALAIGGFLGIMAVLYQDMITGLFGAFFVFQAVTNTGCMVSQTCGVPANKKSTKPDNETEIEFTEIKTD
jgi:hypothetical protein